MKRAEYISKMWADDLAKVVERVEFSRSMLDNKHDHFKTHRCELTYLDMYIFSYAFEEIIF